jgi:hypothetical protein
MSAGLFYVAIAFLGTGGCQPSVAWSQFQCLKPGMTQRQIERLFDRPGEYDNYVSFGYYATWSIGHCTVSLRFEGSEGTGQLADGCLVCANCTLLRLRKPPNSLWQCTCPFLWPADNVHPCCD